MTREHRRFVAILSADEPGVRRRAVNRKLRGVETLPEAGAAMLLGFGQNDEPPADEELVAAKSEAGADR